MQQEEEAQSQLPDQPKPKDWRWLPGVIAVAVIVLISALIFTFRQDLIDRYNYLSFTPSDEVVKIAESAEFSDSGKFYLYASKTEINDSSNFNNNCPQKETNNVILGCYANKRIFIYDVKNNETLSGVKELTAAHEMLHAAWDRLSIIDKNRLSTLLTNAYQQLKTEELTNRMAYYDRNQNGDQIVELHSIIGTEFEDIGQELESYYSRYFDDRKSIVATYKEYSSIIADIESRRAILKEDIDSLYAQLMASYEQYNSDVATLNAEIEALNAERASIDTSNYQAVNNFNRKRYEILVQIELLDKRRTDIESTQKIYNDKVAEYNKLVLAGNELSTSLNSTLEETTDIGT